MWDYSYMKTATTTARKDMMSFFNRDPLHLKRFATTARQRITIAESPDELKTLIGEIDSILVAFPAGGLTDTQLATLAALRSRAAAKLAKLGKLER
ncbi:MAG TPA: hypothetical protein VE645_18950 [Pseudonocardiaceae bacterium]|jgi:hypothetical protein|nr:hypothetical protein [Pseudonocardiaceae bacterium]